MNHFSNITQLSDSIKDKKHSNDDIDLNLSIMLLIIIQILFGIICCGGRYVCNMEIEQTVLSLIYKFIKNNQIFNNQAKPTIQVIKFNKILITILFFFLAGLFEIGGGYLIWIWLRDGMSWILGALGGFILFLYAVVPTFQPSFFHRIYAAYGGIFIVMSLLWGWLFQGIAPDMYDIIGASIALVGVIIIYYAPRKGEQVWTKS